MLMLLCVFEGHFSKSMYFAIAAFDFSTTAPSIKNQMLSLLCVYEGRFSKTLCFVIAVFDFCTTAPSIQIEMIILWCVSEGQMSKTVFCNSSVRLVHYSSEYRH